MRRGARAALFVILLGLLATTAYYTRSGVTALGEARNASADAQRQIGILDQRIQTLREWREHADALDAVLARSNRLGLERERRSQRRLSLSRSKVARTRAMKLLGATVSGARSLFIPDSYTLRVLAPEQGLFSRPPWAARNIELALSGTLHLRREGEA